MTRGSMWLKLLSETLIIRLHIDTADSIADTKVHTGQLVLVLCACGSLRKMLDSWGKQVCVCASGIVQIGMGAARTTKDRRR